MSRSRVSPRSRSLFRSLCSISFCPYSHSFGGHCLILSLLVSVYISNALNSDELRTELRTVLKLYVYFHKAAEHFRKYVLVRLFYLFVFAPDAYAKYICFLGDRHWCWNAMLKHTPFHSHLSAFIAFIFTQFPRKCTSHRNRWNFFLTSASSSSLSLPSLFLDQRMSRVLHSIDILRL